jgi:type IV secretory pathway VirB10-like protein
MCFKKKAAPAPAPAPAPAAPPVLSATETENKAAAQQRVESEAEVQKTVQERARIKAKDIEQAISASTANQSRRGRSGSIGRRSLLQSAAGGAGFLSRFDR